MKATSAGGLAGYAAGGVPGAAIGGGLALAGQLKTSQVAARKDEDRKPIQANAIRNAIPAAAVGVGAGLATEKGYQVMKKSKAYARLARKRLAKIRGFEAILDSAMDFARREQPRRGPGQEHAGEFIGHKGIVWGTEAPHKLNPDFREGATDAKSRDRLIPDERKPFQIPEVRSGVLRDARVYNKWGGRAVRTGRDVADVVRGKPRKKDASGRPQKREWEKSYFKNMAGTAATAAGILIAGRKVRNSPKLRAKIAGAAESAKRKGNAAVDWAADKFFESIEPGMINFMTLNQGLGVLGAGVVAAGSAKLLARKLKKRKEGQEGAGGPDSSRFTKEYLKTDAGEDEYWDSLEKSRKPKTKGLSAIEPRMIEFSFPITDERGRQVFRIDDVRGNSARILQGDKPKRERRQKYWHERASNERKLWAAGAVAAGATGLLVGSKAAGTGKKLRDRLKKGFKKPAAVSKPSNVVPMERSA